MGIKTIAVLLALLACYFVTGCSIRENEVDSLAMAREAVTNRDYDSASRHAGEVIENDPENREAAIILEYIEYGDNMLHAAYWENDTEALEYLAGIVHDIEQLCPRFNTTVLVLAAAWGHTDMVIILLEAGADPNHGADSDGLTALMWACKNFDEQLEMARALLEAGAEVNVRSKYDETPLTIAERYMNPNIVELLKEYGAVE